MSDDEDKGPSLAALKARFKWPLSGRSSSAGLVKTPAWLPLPKIVLAAFGLNTLFLLIGLIVSGLVLGGTISIKAPAIGLTESLVLISCLFGLAYMVFHILAARRPDPAEGASSQRSARHTKIILWGRITTALWAISLLAVAITLARLAPDDATSSATGALQAGLAACIVSCLDMTVVLLVVERTRQPFVLPWISPPMPEGQSSAAKALIDGILDDGVAGQADAEPTASRASCSIDDEPSSSQPRKDKAPSHDQDPAASSSTLAPPPSFGDGGFPLPSATTLVDRPDLWDRVDEDATKTSIKLPPHPSVFWGPAGAQTQAHAIPQMPQIPQMPPIPPQHMYASYLQPMSSPYPFYPPPPTYLSPMPTPLHPPAAVPSSSAPAAFATPSAPAVPSRPPLSRAAGRASSRYSAAASTIAAPIQGVNGPRPLYETGRLHSYAAYTDATHGDGTRSDGVRSVPPVNTKRLFDQAVQGLKTAGQRSETNAYDDSVHVPGSFVDV